MGSRLPPGRNTRVDRHRTLTPGGSPESRHDAGSQIRSIERISPLERLQDAFGKRARIIGLDHDAIRGCHEFFRAAASGQNKRCAARQGLRGHGTEGLPPSGRLLRFRIPDGKREHARQEVEAIRAPPAVGLDQHLGIRWREELHAESGQPRPQHPFGRDARFAVGSSWSEASDPSRDTRASVQRMPQLRLRQFRDVVDLPAWFGTHLAARGAVLQLAVLGISSALLLILVVNTFAAAQREGTACRTRVCLLDSRRSRADAAQAKDLPMCQCRQPRNPVFCILPPHLLRELARNGTPAERDIALATLATDQTARISRVTYEMQAAGARPALMSTGPAEKHRTIYDGGRLEALPGRVVRNEGGKAVRDVAANEAYQGLGATWDFYVAAYQRNSIDDEGMRLDATVHYAERYDNAFWNGQQMVFGDGDGDRRHGVGARGTHLVRDDPRPPAQVDGAVRRIRASDCDGREPARSCAPMIVVLETEGGLAPVPGLQRPITVDSTDLEPEQAARLSKLVGDTNLFERPASAGNALPSAADVRTYTLTITDGARRHSMQFTDPVSDSQLAALRDFVKAHAGTG